MDEINGDFSANRRGPGDWRQTTSPIPRLAPTQVARIYGMPILDVDKARNGDGHQSAAWPQASPAIDNPLYYLDRTLMLFGDAKSFVGSIVPRTRRRPRVAVYSLKPARGDHTSFCIVEK